jgi:hypothetical protein
MKKLIALLLALTLCVSLCACGGSTGETEPQETAAVEQEEPSTEDTEEPEETETEEELADDAVKYQLGDTVETDILAITLDYASFAIALERSYGDDYLMPKEYDATEDAKNPYVAAKGHTLVAIEYTANNLDRTSVSFDGSLVSQFISVTYDGQKYFPSTNYKYCSENGAAWEEYDGSNVLLFAGDQKTMRCYVDIPTDIEDLTDTFTLTFRLPNSAGDTEDFSFIVTEEDRAARSEEEASLGE